MKLLITEIVDIDARNENFIHDFLLKLHIFITASESMLLLLKYFF